MDPRLIALLMQHQQQGGMFGGQPQMAQPDPNDPQQQHGGGLSPLTAISPMGGLLASHGGIGKAALFGLSPIMGLANLFGAFK